VACVRHYFAAEVSRHPEELQPVLFRDIPARIIRRAS
jgi:hypothetical protein